ncbi:MAG TPA: ArsR family transcriptional regulator [bacterium]|jgi:predicted ArsR family transcriptional regulator|nr:ArsR family transcriptional regulator [bacterium]
MAETRRRLLDVLRLRGGQTVEDLTGALGVTRTAVTTQLAALRADGFVARGGLQAGRRRPSVVYVLTPAADALFPKNYDEFASALMAAVRDGGDLKRILRHIGDEWIARDLSAVRGLQGWPRYERARAVLAERGFMPVLERTVSGYVLREHNCPVMRLAVAHPEVCDMVHRWLEALFGVSLTRTQCLRRGDPYSAYTMASGRLPATRPSPRTGGADG